MIEIAIWTLAAIGLIIVAFAVAVALIVFWITVLLTAFSVLDWLNRRLG